MSFPTKSKFFYSDFFDPESLIYYRKNIIAFVEDIVFHKDFIGNGGNLFLSEQQKEILLSIQNNKRVSVKSGRGIGKTAAIAFACIWWLCMYPEHNKFVCTAPSFKTLKSGLWNEICMWFEKSLVAPIFTIGAEKIFLTEKKNSCYAEPRTAREKESMSGIHADHLLIICDEASGTDDDILRTLDATLTSGGLNKICLITNPTKTTGFFFDTFEKDSRRWVTHTYSSADSPFVDKEHRQVTPCIGLSQRQVDIFALDVPTPNPSHPAVVPQGFFRFMHIHPVLFPELVHELAVPDYTGDSHAVHLGPATQLYSRFSPFA